MKLGTKQKTYGLVLALTATGFVVDRLFFTPPNSEAANVAPAPMAQPSSSASAAPATIATSDAPAASAGWLAERFRSASGSSDNDLRDVFALPASWRPAVKAVPVAAPKPQLLGDQFRKDHHLEAVVINGKHGRAVVDGQFVPVGGAVAGFRLVSVTQRSAQFVHDDEQVSLSLTDGDGGSVR